MKRYRSAGLVLLLPGLLAAGLLLQAQQDQEQGQFGELLANGQSVHGTITAIHGGALTLKDEAGQLYQVETGVNTFFRKDRDPIQLKDLHPGDIVFAAGEQDNAAKALGAVFVVEIDPAEYEKARAAFGRTWTAGRVEAIHNLEITIERPDHVKQVIAVDENTSFREQHQSITLGDLQVGDAISARGAVEKGRFRATVLAVRPKGQRIAGPPPAANANRN
jgi:Domain of unknown function (DUF5666)